MAFLPPDFKQRFPHAVKPVMDSLQRYLDTHSLPELEKLSKKQINEAINEHICVALLPHFKKPVMDSLQRYLEAAAVDAEADADADADADAEADEADAEADAQLQRQLDLKFESEFQRRFEAASATAAV